MNSREELVRQILSDLEKQDEWDEKKLIACKEGLRERILSNIEKESEFWDEEELADDYGWYELVENIYRSICVSIYAEMPQKMKLPEDKLQICLEYASQYFFCDCILAMGKSYKEIWLDAEANEEISFKDFFRIFAEFIKDIQDFEIEEDTGDELRQLRDMLGKDEIKGYVQNRYSYIWKPKRKGKKGEDEDYVEMNVWAQMKRFWNKWIVTADKQNMSGQECIFWLILAVIYNFAEDFGSEDLKKAGKCLKNVRDTGSADISEALQWGFKCVYQITINDRKYTRFSKYFGNYGIFGFITLMDRFNYVQFVVKKRVWNYLTGQLDIPEKHFSDYGASGMKQAIVRQSIESSRLYGPLTGKNRSDGRELELLLGV